MTLWFVRGGSYGEHESKFINEHKVCLTRDELTATDMPTIADYGGIKQRVIQLFPNEPVRKLGNWSRQMWAFVLAMKEGDWIVMSRKNKSTIALGEIKSKCQFDASAANDYRHYREIKWLDTEIPRSNFNQDVPYSFDAFLTVYEIKHNDVEARIRAIAKHNWQVSSIDATPVQGCR